ncbi:MAG TPA: hypothetical protein VF527_15940 [Pyrinomonadaceae bacterium]
MERAIEFLLQSQANLEAQIAETNRIVQLQAETQSEFIQIVTSSFERLAATQARTDEIIAASQARTDERIAQSQTRTDERIAQSQALTDERIAEANARGAATDARLDRIAAMLDRHIQEGHGNA